MRVFLIGMLFSIVCICSFSQVFAVGVTLQSQEDAFNAFCLELEKLNVGHSSSLDYPEASAMWADANDSHSMANCLISDVNALRTLIGTLTKNGNTHATPAGVSSWAQGVVDDAGDSLSCDTLALWDDVEVKKTAANSAMGSALSCKTITDEMDPAEETNESIQQARNNLTSANSAFFTANEAYSDAIDASWGSSSNVKLDLDDAISEQYIGIQKRFDDLTALYDTLINDGWVLP